MGIAVEVLEYKGVLADLPALRHNRGPQRQNHSTITAKTTSQKYIYIKSPSRYAYQASPLFYISNVSLVKFGFSKASIERTVHLTKQKLAPRGAWLHQKSCQEISCTVVALLALKKCVSSDAL